MATGKEYAKLAIEVYNTKPQVGYIWGTRGVLWTKERQAALEKTTDPDREMGRKYGKKWIGHIVYDCSGLTSKLAEKLGCKFHHGSNSSYNYDCAYKGKKTKGMKIPVGAWVYTGDASKHGHIGIVVDDLWVVEAMGTLKGVTRTRIDDKKWTYWGLAKGMKFDFIPGKDAGAPNQPATSESKKDEKPVETVCYPTIRRGTKGDLVRKLQQYLAMDGSSLAIDGIFGPGTQSAVRAFQRKYGLTVDGIVGPQTWGKLLELYA